MKNRSKFIVLAALFLGSAVLLLWPGHHDVVLSQSEAPLATSTLPSQPGTSEMVGTALPVANPLKAMMQTPIEFYGIVLDQEGNPVPSANVTGSVLDSEKGSPISTTTGNDGKFLILSQGMDIHLSVEKDGYYFVEKGGRLRPSSQGFDVGMEDSPRAYQPDPSSPIVFHLQKAGNPVLLETLRGQSKVPRDGRPITISLSKTSKAALSVSCRTLEDPTQPPNAPYDWRCEVTVIGGEIQEADDDSGFLAPADGFTQLAVIDMPKTLDRKQWNRRASKNYWVRFADKTFGKISFKMIAGGDHFAMVNGFRNPTPHDLNLEPKLDDR